MPSRKKKIALFLATMVGITGLQAAEDLSTMFSEGTTSGQIREFSISRSVEYTDSAKDYTRNANAIGGYLKFETADFKGLSLGTALYTTNGFYLDSPRDDYKKVDPTLLGSNNESYSLLGEAYVQYKAGNTAFKGGRQKLNTPMAGADDARMIPNLFEAYVLSNTDVPDTTLVAAHVTRFAQGTFGRAYDGGILAATAGYSAVDSRDQVGGFVNMGTYAIGQKTDGVSVAAAVYSGVENLKVQLWDYYAHDILNAVYGQVDFSWTCLLHDAIKPFVAAQFIKENDLGDAYAGDVDSMYWGAKLGAKVENFTAYVAYSQQSEAEAGEELTKATITPWGGMPAYTQGMVTRHMFLAGTVATKVAASYNWKAFGPNLKTVAYYAMFDMADNNGYTSDDASEAGFDVIYYPGLVENLQLRLRGNYATDFNVNAAGDTVGWNEYRFIVNYNF